MVAIPAVVAYNIFQGRVRRTLGRVDAMAHLILAGRMKRKSGSRWIVEQGSVGYVSAASRFEDDDSAG